MTRRWRQDIGTGVQPLRRLLAQRRFAALLCAATLLLKLLVPAGYMIDAAQGRFAIVVCPGIVPAAATASHAAMPAGMDMAGGMAAASHRAMPGHGKTGEHGRPDMPCAFASLTAATLGAIDPIQLALLIGFLLAVGLAPVAAPCLRRAVRLRPPLRGPPAIL